jgi:hypothetical protein
MVLTVGSLGVRSRDSSVGTATRLRAGRPRSQGSIPDRGKTFSLLYNIQTGPGAHPASYPMGTGGSFARGKAAGV